MEKDKEEKRNENGEKVIRIAWLSRIIADVEVLPDHSIQLVDTSGHAHLLGSSEKVHKQFKAWFKGVFCKGKTATLTVFKEVTVQKKEELNIEMTDAIDASNAGAVLETIVNESRIEKFLTLPGELPAVLNESKSEEKIL